MNILALDPGTRTGWALSEHGRIESGTDVFDVKRGESPGTRYLRFNRWLDAMVLVENVGPPRVATIVYEQTHHRGGAATEIAAGFATRIQEFCAWHGLEHAAVHSATLKKFTTGRGNAKKPEMLEAVARRWRRVDSDDEADAVALLYWSLENLVGAVRWRGLPAPERVRDE